MNKLVVMTLAVLSIVAFSPVTSAKTQSNKAAISKVAKVNAVAKININTAGAKELAEVLTGVGMKKAKAIVNFRNQNGSFKKIEDLAAVKGIGVATIVKNEGRIVLR